jgi:hypothetical protein
MNGVGGDPPRNRAVVAIQRKQREDREATAARARDVARKARRTPLEVAIEAIEEKRYLADVADAQAESSTDPARRVELTTTAAQLRRQARKLEVAMPADIAIETPRQIRSDFTARAATITADLNKLAEDDGKEASWKRRQRATLLDQLDAARSRADAALNQWAVKSAQAANKALARDSRTPEMVSRDMSAEMAATRLSKTVDSQTAARNILLGEARRYAAAGDELKARGYAMAAQQHGVPEATRLLAELEARYQDSWEGHGAAREAIAAVESQIRGWQTDSAAAHARAGAAAVAAATRVGDPTDSLSESYVVESISAKLAAQREAIATDQPFADPVGPTSSAGAAPGPVIGSASSAAR